METQMAAGPRISVVMATYNQAAYLREALASLENQTLPKDQFEIIVVNDGSTDATPKILDEYGSRITRVDQDNQGLVASCNRGLALAAGKYFARLDSDDFVDREWLEILQTTIDAHPEAACVYPDFMEIAAGGEKYVALNADNIYQFQACGPIFPTGLIRQLGGFRALYWEEFDLYLRLKPKGAFVHVPRPLYMYRRHEQNMTGNKSRRLQGWNELASVWGADALRAAGKSEELEEALRNG